MQNDGTVTVTVEPGGAELVIRRTCNRCYGRAVAVTELERIELASGYGTAHRVENDTNPERTACGILATGPAWWWPS